VAAMTSSDRQLVENWRAGSVPGSYIKQLARTVGMFFLATTAFLHSNAYSKDLTLYLDFFATDACDKPCSETWSSGGSSWFIEFGRFDQNSQAENRVIADYRWLRGYKGPVLSGGEYLQCDAATVEKGLVFWTGGRGWINEVIFSHICRYRNIDSTRQPGPDIDNVVLGSALIDGYCEPGFFEYGNYATGECGRIPNDCLKYPDNKAFGCGRIVADMEKIKKPAQDPTRVFHQTQTCIARKSCDLRCQMDNCKWLDLVIPSFVDPYLQQHGRWPEIEGICGQLKQKYGSSQLGQQFTDGECAARMAGYHIDTDLRKALNAFGCGSDADWQAVATVIQQCASATTQDVAPGWAKGVAESVSSATVMFLRDRVRIACLDYRQGRGLDPVMDPSEKGKLCLQP
jgi:hypothetical protein